MRARLIGAPILLFAATCLLGCENTAAPKPATIPFVAQREVAAIELADAHDRILAASTDPALQELRVAIDALHGEVETADENVLTVRIGEASQALEAYAKNAADSTRLDEADLDVLRLSLSHVLHLRDLPVDGTALLPNDAKK